jgi:hypothetical protein
MSTNNISKPSDIPTTVVHKFLSALEQQGIPSNVIDRLRTELVSERKPSRKTLADAIFKDEPLV